MEKKKKALGGDPLSWLKGKNSETNESEVPAREEQTEQTPSEPEAEEEEVVKTVPAAAKEDTRPVTSETPRIHKNIVLGETEPAYQTRFRTPPKPKENPATIFVVVYTVLLLILGFLVFRDLTKKINALEAKLSKIEKKIDSDYLRYDDTDF